VNDPWQNDPSKSVGLASIEKALGRGVPAEAMAFYGRWWQLETWLRWLVHLELRARYGEAWEEHVVDAAGKRAIRDQENAYIASPDADFLLAYLDTGNLFSLIAEPEVWELLGSSLPPRKRWDGLADELSSLRNRNAHYRRPHPDDLQQLERVLRSLEKGAKGSIRAFNEQSRLWKDEDPVARRWADPQGPERDRLSHARNSYNTELQIRVSRRPWAPQSAGPGHLWHAEYVMREGRYLSPRVLWNSSYLDPYRQIVVQVTMEYPGFLSIAFSMADDPELVGEAIDRILEAVLVEGERTASPEQYDNWVLEGVGLDPRLRTYDPFFVPDSVENEAPYFNAGAHDVSARGA
jgi:hypothetical protein